MDYLNCQQLDQANQLIDDHLTEIVVGQETVELSAALGRVTAAEIRATEDLPGYSRSTVDGFAVRSEDSFGATDSTAAFFTVIGEVVMGQAADFELHPGQAVAIPTGGMLPCGADAVVMLEYTEQPDTKSLLVQKVAAPYENVVRRGEDIAAGSVLVEAGIRLSAKHIGLLAACGCCAVPVRTPLRVALVSSGDELVDIGETPQMGQVRDVNSYSLAALLAEWGCEVHRMGIVRDSFDLFLAQLSSAVQTCQLVIISGGSSVGAKDFTVPAIQALGSPGLLMHGLAIKPGKPTIFGMAGKVPVFGLPGHPVAALVVCEQLVAAAVWKMTGMKANARLKRVPAILNRNIASVPGRDDFITVRIDESATGLVAEPLIGKSGLISLISKAEGILHIPAEKSGLHQGELVWVSLMGRKGE